MRPRTAGPSNPSRATEPDGDRPSLDDDWHSSLAVGEPEHTRHAGRVPLDVDVVDWNLPPGEILTGRQRIGSGVLPEDQDGLIAHWLRIARNALRFNPVCRPAGRRLTACETVHIIEPERRPSMPLVLCLVVALAAVVASTPLPSATVAQASSAAEVARQVQDRNTGRDSRASMRMTLVDRQNRARERVLTLVSLRGRGTPGAGPAAADGDRLLIRFTYPGDIRGTSFLVWEHPDADDERFLHLPALGRVRRIAGAETQESFVGSDFTYEDIGGREFDEYTYAFAGADGERASWTPPSGASRAAWRLESTRTGPSAEFPRVVSLVLKDSLVVVAADIFNRRNEREKSYTVRRLDRIEGIWTVMDSVMSNHREKTRTEIVVENMDYNIGLKESDFSRRELERGAAK